MYIVPINSKDNYNNPQYLPTFFLHYVLFKTVLQNEALKRIQPMKKSNLYLEPNTTANFLKKLHSGIFLFSKFTKYGINLRKKLEYCAKLAYVKNLSIFGKISDLDKILRKNVKILGNIIDPETIFN